MSLAIIDKDSVFGFDVDISEVVGGNFILDREHARINALAENLHIVRADIDIVGGVLDGIINIRCQRLVAVLYNNASAVFVDVKIFAGVSVRIRLDRRCRLAERNVPAPLCIERHVGANIDFGLILISSASAVGGGVPRYKIVGVAREGVCHQFYLARHRPYDYLIIKFAVNIVIEGNYKNIVGCEIAVAILASIGGNLAILVLADRAISTYADECIATCKYVIGTCNRRPIGIFLGADSGERGTTRKHLSDVGCFAHIKIANVELFERCATIEHLYEISHVASLKIGNVYLSEIFATEKHI